MAKDVNNNIPLKLVKLSEDIESFNNYPWGHDNYKLTVKYLLDPFSPKTNNLFGFQWDFMAWAFEVIPHLRHQVTAKKEILSPRILRWLRAKNVKNPLDLFNPPHDAYIDEILSLMRERHLRYPEYYDSIDRIMDLNFSINFKQRSIRPYPGGMHWIGAKRILTVMNLNKTHFVTIEILLYKGRIHVYDCNLMGMEHDKFLTFIQPVFELLPSLLKQSRIMKHLSDKFLNEPWEFEVRLEPMVKITTKPRAGHIHLHLSSIFLPTQQFNLPKPCCVTMQLVE
ncbi:hypothetical protein H5410_061546 [Solanum commersonii]|uniref:Ubiquitin-like protease family profile domain-containing protein n=1 Tax=Solanum commersonii TaxID=4109 RepID=A0A9J5W965_SOLCO|nr:hypothetical protein H5410_061546 [Solanum commersonii]